MSCATLRARLGVTAATLTAGLALTLVPGFTTASNATSSTSAHITTASAPATAAASRHSHRRVQHARALRRHNRLVHRVMTVASHQRGKPYSYGAAGPRAFDCSGLVMYVYQHAVHRALPHNAAAQYHSLHHISRDRLRKGDLIFTDDGSITHVGIFAGHHHWWVAPHTGTHVQKQRIYSAHFVYARVLRIRH